MNITLSSLHPVRLLCYSWGVWFLLFLLIPVSYGNVEYSLEAIATLVLLLLSFILGTQLFNVLPKKDIVNATTMFSENYTYKVAFYIIFTIGFFGVFLKMYEHFILHNILTQPSFFSYKMSRVQNQLNSGIIGVISALTYPFGLVSLMLNIRFQYLTGFIKKSFIWFIGCFWFFDALFLSSMTTIIYLLAFISITFVIKKSVYKNISVKISISSIVILISVSVFYFVYLTSFRVNLEFIAIALDARALTPSFNIDSVLLFSLISFLHYLVHGVVEWFRLFEHVGLNNYYLGIYEFYPVAKIFSVLGLNIPSFFELAQVAHKTGVYTTFWGAFILDFGIFSFFVSFMLGIIAMALFRGVLLGSFACYLIYPIFSAQIIFSSIMNILSGVVVYYLVSILISIILIHFYKRSSS